MLKKLPKTTGASADLLYTTREARLRLEKEVEKLRSEEATLRDHLLRLLPAADSTSVTGKLATVSIVRLTVPDVQDWDAVYAYIKRTGAFELLQRRIGVEAWRERNDAKRPVPGIAAQLAYKVHCSRAGATVKKN